MVCAVSAAKGAPATVRIVLGDGISPPARLAATEKLCGAPSLPAKAEIEAAVREELPAAGDFHASADYKRHYAAVTVADIIHGFFESGGAS